MIDVSKATCATCPCWHHQGECELNPPVNGMFPVTYSTTSCSHHPIRRAAYELAVEAAKEGRRNG